MLSTIIGIMDAFALSRAALAACLAGLVTGGCAVSAIESTPEDIPAPAAWSRGGESGAVSVDWLATFGDPKLEQLVSDALARNFVLEQQRQQLESVRQSVTIARSARLPSFALSLDGSRRGAEDASGDSSIAESYDATLDGRFEVDVWGRLSSAQQSAEMQLAAQVARLEAAERTLAGQTAAQYFDVLEATQLLAVARRRLEVAIESQDIVASGYRQGLNEALDLYLARNVVERERANVAQQEQARLEAIAALQLSLARYPDGEFGETDELPVPVDPIPVGLPSELLTRRPDVQEAWLTLLAADAQLAAAHKARFPSLSLVGSAGTTSVAFSDLVDAGATGWSLAFGLTQPLFQGGQLAAQEAQARAQVRATEQAWLDVVYTAFAEVENAISRTTSLDAQYEAQLKAETNSRTALQIALDQYQRGLVDYTTVLESQRQAFEAAATVVQLRNQRLQNRLALYIALGGNFETTT